MTTPPRRKPSGPERSGGQSLIEHLEGKLRRADEASVRAAVRSIVESPILEEFRAQVAAYDRDHPEARKGEGPVAIPQREIRDRIGEIPVGVLTRRTRAALKRPTGAESTLSPIVRLSAETALKQLARHPDITAEHYRRLPTLLEHGRFGVESDRRLVFYGKFQSRWYRAVVKVTAYTNETYLTSYCRANPAQSSGEHPTGDRLGRRGGGAWWGPQIQADARQPHIALSPIGIRLRHGEYHRVTCAGGSIAREAMCPGERYRHRLGPWSWRNARRPDSGAPPPTPWTTGPTGRPDPGGRRSRPRTVTLRHDLYRTHEGDSHLRRTVGIVKPVPTVWRMVGPVLRPKPVSPHGTPLPGKRATADGKSPCHMRRENHSALGDACCRVRPGGRIGRNGVSPSAGGGAWWGPPPGRSRHPHMSLRFRGSVLRPAENYRVHAPVEA